MPLPFSVKLYFHKESRSLYWVNCQKTPSHYRIQFTACKLYILTGTTQSSKVPHHDRGSSWCEILEENHPTPPRIITRAEPQRGSFWCLLTERKKKCTNRKSSENPDDFAEAFFTKMQRWLTPTGRSLSLHRQQWWSSKKKDQKIHSVAMESPKTTSAVFCGNKMVLVRFSLKIILENTHHVTIVVYWEGSGISRKIHHNCWRRWN